MLDNLSRIGRMSVLLAAIAAAPIAVQAQERTGRDELLSRPPVAGSARAAGDAADETSQLDEAFRIDIQSITVAFDYHPDQNYVAAAAHLEFVMRPGQSVPRFHFPPAERNPSVVSSLRLDGQAVSFPGASVRSVRIAGSSQTILEIDRQLAAGQVHTLDLAYRLDRPSNYPRFSTEVNDLAGRGNEELFPTLNTPGELARHHFALRVHGNRAFRCIGSGLVEREDDAEEAVQQWLLDTEREVASYTVMFVLVPAAGTDLRERVIDGIPVRILAIDGGPSIEAAFVTLQDWLPRLQAAFGLYPAPRGLSVFLVSQGGGMEYFGATISTSSALTHEVVHGYFACATITRTYRDSWLDEAITQWFDGVSHGSTFAPIDDAYRGNWVGARSPVSVGFSRLAYSDGARIVQALATRLGGTDRLRLFLRYVHERYAFRPFTTMEFVEYLRDFSGIDLQPQFERWLFQAGGN